MRVLGLSGSLRQDSLNRKLLELAARRLGSQTDVELWSGLAWVPPFNEDDETPTPPAVAVLHEEAARADGLLIATPEYNHSLPGQLKNALDWLSRPPGQSVLIDKPVAVLGASPSPYGAVQAQAEVRKVLGAIGAMVVPEELAVPGAFSAFDDSGELVDDSLRDGLDRLIAALRGAVERRLATVA